MASLDVVEKIIKWREIKGDHDAAFMWNGVNYLLRMSTDLDYLMGYLVVRRWIGFSIIRNPFCIPFPMEEGVDMFSEAVLAPKHAGGMEGFAVGGITEKTMRTKYAIRPRSTRSAGSEHNITTGGPYRARGDASSANPSSPSGATQSSAGRIAGRREEATASSIVLNEDMVKIRQAEMVILKEEEKLGKVARDPMGVIYPVDQAAMRFVAYEMQKDYKRSIHEPAVSREEEINLHSAKVSTRDE